MFQNRTAGAEVDDCGRNWHDYEVTSWVAVGSASWPDLGEISLCNYRRHEVPQAVNRRSAAQVDWRFVKMMNDPRALGRDYGLSASLAPFR